MELLEAYTERLDHLAFSIRLKQSHNFMRSILANASVAGSFDTVL
jgi:hypothetical protein